MAGMGASLKKNLGGFLRGSLNPIKIFTDKKTRAATLDPLDIAKEPKIPKVPDPVVMPIPDEDEELRARQRAYAARRQQSGRVSTILSDSEPLG